MPALVRSEVFARFPAPWPDDVQPAIRSALAATPRRKLVVLDDDPTGTQTVHEIAVVTRWDEATLRAELERPEPGFYVLTNSRALTPAAARALNLELARNLRAAARASGIEVTLASRSDSTLRGHFPLEIDALAEVGGPFDLTLLAPYFEAGGRYTIDDTHYVADGDKLVPAAETPFARDAAFGFNHSNLRAWIEEKSHGRIRAGEVISVPLDRIRRDGPDAVLDVLLRAPRGATVVVNAAAPRDIEVVALATLRAEARGKRIVFRTAASLVAARLGIAPRPTLDLTSIGYDAATGGLVVVGSYVPKTTQQLERLLATRSLHAIELDVEALLNPALVGGTVRDAAARLNALIARGADTVVYTSRRLITGETAERSLAIGEHVSNALITIVRSLTAAPRFLIAKGGITSSDIATKALHVRRAVVRGQLLPGVPVWELGPEAKFPGLPYVVFPGNVGGPDALAEAVTRLSPAFNPP